MVKHEPWKASAPEVYLLRTTDGSVPRGLDPNTMFPSEKFSKKWVEVMTWDLDIIRSIYCTFSDSR